MGIRTARPIHCPNLPVRLRRLAKVDQAQASWICDTLSRRGGRLTRSSIRLHLGAGFEGDQRLDEVLDTMVQTNLLECRDDAYHLIAGESRRPTHSADRSLLAV
jgi:hypothetical protein